MNEILWYLLEYFIAIPVLAIVLFMWGRKRGWGVGSFVLRLIAIVFAGVVYFQIAHVPVSSQWIESTMKTKPINECQRKALRSASLEGVTAAEFASIRNKAKC